MKLRIHLAALAALSVVLVLPAVAFAQTASPPAPLPGLTESTVTIALVGAVAAFLVSAWNTGKVFGVATLPQAWLPYVALASVFVGAGYASLAAAGLVSALALVNAGLAGFYALVAYSGGAAAHGAITTHIDKARVARAAAKVALVLGLLLLGGSQSACLSSAAIVPVTSANSSQVATCQTTATEHNAFVLTGISSGAIATGLGSVAAAVPGSNASLQTGLAIGAAVAAGVTAIATGGAGLTAASFTNGQCPSVVGALPAAQPASEGAPPPILPKLSELDTTEVTVTQAVRP